MAKARLFVVTYNPQLNIVRAPSSYERFTSTSRYVATELPIYEQLRNEWNAEVSDVLEALEATATFVGGGAKTDCIGYPELTAHKKNGKRYVTPWIRVSVTIILMDVDTSQDDAIAAYFFAELFKQEELVPIKLADDNAGFGLVATMEPIQISKL